ncbi:restriction endonuclease subunit S [Arthrobacter sp. MDT1-48-3]
MSIVPEGWHRTRIGDVASFLTGYPFPSAKFVKFGTRLARGSNIKRGELDWSPSITRFWPQPDTRIRDYELSDGDILIAMDGALVGRSFARISRADLPAYLVQRVARLRGYSVDQDLLYQWIKAPEFARWVDDRKTQTAIPHISPDDIRGFEIVVPRARKEQALIGEVLGDIDNLINALKHLIAKKRDVQQGMMQELLTGRTRLPGFTGDWRMITLGDHVTYVRTVALSRDELDRESPLRYLHYGDVHTRSSVFLDAATERMPRAASHLASRAGRLMPGDLVFADASEDLDGVGKSVEISDVPPEGVVPGLHTIAARFDKSVLADGFKAYIQFMPAFRAALLRLAAGTKVLATTRSYLSSIALTLPGTAEQFAIAEVLQNADAETEALERRLESARAVKVGMMQELLAGRTRLPMMEET